MHEFFWVLLLQTVLGFFSFFHVFSFDCFQQSSSKFQNLAVQLSAIVVFLADKLHFSLSYSRLNVIASQLTSFHA